MLNIGYSRIVVLLHGIRTDAYWHQQFEEIVSALPDGKETLVLSRKYGNFPVVQYAIPFLRKKKVIWLRKMLEDIQLRYPLTNICIIAHSFGAYLTTEVLKRTPRLKIDSLILCGSVVRRDFEWSKLTDNNNVKQVVNDCGAADLWPVLSRNLIPGTGDAGTFGFDLNGGQVRNRFFQYYDHGSFFTQTHIREYWWPFISSGTIQPGPIPVPQPIFLARLLASPVGRIATRIIGLVIILSPLCVYLPVNINPFEYKNEPLSEGLKAEITKENITSESPASTTIITVKRDDTNVDLARVVGIAVLQKLEQRKNEEVWQSHVSDWARNKITKEAFLANMTMIQSKLGGMGSDRELIQQSVADVNVATGYKGETFTFLYSTSFLTGKVYEKVLLIHEGNTYQLAGYSCTTTSGYTLGEFGMP